MKMSSINSSTHLTYENRINFGSFYTPQRYVDIVGQWLKAENIGSDAVIADITCGGGAFFALHKIFPDNQYIGNDIDQSALLTAEKYFPFVRSADKIDAVSAVRRRLRNYESKGFPEIGETQQRTMEIREVFLHQHLLDSMGHNVLDGIFEAIPESELADMLSRESLDHIKYEENVGLWCRYCPVREVCATPYSA